MWGPGEVTVTRTVTPDEVDWLKRTYTPGERLWTFTGCTYGCIDNSKGTALSELEGENPFFEFPDDAWEFVPPQDEEV